MGAHLGTMGRSDHHPHDVSHVDDRSRFVRKRVAADPRSAARARGEFAGWLGTHFVLDSDRFSDVLLAVNEALANAAEFAYCPTPQRGTIDVSATYDHDSSALLVTVNDRGRWRDKPPVQHEQQRRGRGIPLMRALADELTIDRTPHGTHVTLTWTGLTHR